jgi:hypothetical protein
MLPELVAKVTPVLHGWETRIDKYSELPKLCISTEDFNVCNSLVANELVSGIDHFATFWKVVDISGVDKAICKAALVSLKDIEISCIQWGQSNVEAFGSTVKSLKEEKKDAAHWEVVINDASEEAKRRALQLIENGAVAAKCAIRTLPFEIRGSAAGLFNASWPAVITFFGKAWEFIKMVKEGLEMFLGGTWNKLEQAMDAVKAAAEIAIDIVCSILKPRIVAAAV